MPHEVGRNLAHEQVPQRFVIELAWLPRRTVRSHLKVYALPNEVRTARFELILSWTRSKTNGRVARVDAVWPLDYSSTVMTKSERSDIRDTLDQALKEQMPEVHVREWSSTVIADKGPVNKVPV